MTAASKRLPAITTSDGAGARLDRDRLTVHDRSGRVLFEYDAETGRGTLLVPDGDLRIAAPRGAIELVAGEGVRIAAPSLAVHAVESELHLGNVRSTAGKLHATVDDAELTFGKVLRSAERVIEQAGNFYQRVAELCEVKAGRLRTLVREGVWMKGHDVTVLAKKDVRVDGERINLG